MIPLSKNRIYINNYIHCGIFTNFSSPMRFHQKLLTMISFSEEGLVSVVLEVGGVFPLHFAYFKKRKSSGVVWASLMAQTVKNLPAMQRPRFNPWVGKIL